MNKQALIIEKGFKDLQKTQLPAIDLSDNYCEDCNTMIVEKLELRGDYHREIVGYCPHCKNIAT